MATYAQLYAEPEFRAEFEPPALAAFNESQRAFWKLDRTQCGSKGDNRHLRGRHRSRTWTVNSIYSESRTYGNTDQRDKAGDGNWLRATDIGISGPRHWAAARRLDAMVRAGRLPIVAEWFGTFDGQSVVGWFQGEPGESDISHLTHLHVGYWTSLANDADQMQLLHTTLTGAVPQRKEIDMFMFNVVGSDLLWLTWGSGRRHIVNGETRAVYAAAGVSQVKNVALLPGESVDAAALRVGGPLVADGGVPVLLDHYHNLALTGQTGRAVLSE